MQNIYSLQNVYGLLLLLVAGVASATDEVRLYSAIGEPLMAEIPLRSEELKSTAVQLSGGEQDWDLLRDQKRGTVLALSKGVVNVPILQLTLLTDQAERSITLFLNLSAQHDRTAYLQEIIEHRAELIQQNSLLKQQLNQNRSHNQTSWLELPQAVIVSRWGGALLLGSLIALLLLRWWRSAEWIDLEQKKEVEYAPIDQAQQFRQDVEQIEREIQRDIHPESQRPAVEEVSR